MSKRITDLTAMAVAAILGVGRSAVAQDPTITDHGEPPQLSSPITNAVNEPSRVAEYGEPCTTGSHHN